jgi:hypothetical protein
MRWVTATQLTQWADTRACESELPLLIRKLITATGDWAQVNMPGGDSIFKPGWDGICELSTQSGLAPAGSSYWELGRNGDYYQKLKSDFSKRAAVVPIDVQRSATFVFITPRRWAKPERPKLIKKLKSESNWKEILLLDADDLELWLEKSPAVGRWLATLLKMPATEVTGADEFWSTYTQQAEYAFTPALIIAGRTFQEKQIIDYFSGEAGYRELQASSKEEGAAFALSSLLGQFSEQSMFCKTIIITRQDVLKLLNDTYEKLFILYLPEDNESTLNTGPTKNYVLSVVSYQVSLSGNGIVLPLADGGTFAEELIKLGVDHREAYQLTKACGKSPNILRRILADQAGRVTWPAGYDIAELIPIFFAQKFDDEKEGDQEIIAQLYDGNYGAYKAALKKWSLIADHPVVQVANHWRIVSAYDLLFTVGRYLTEEHFRRFETVFGNVLAEHDPALDLKPEMRMAASLYKKESRYSDRLKDGLCQTLMLLSARGAESGININIDPNHFSERLVRKIFTDSDLRFWQSIESKIHWLAEAAPKVFLEAMENMADHHPEIITELFNDQDAGFFVPIYHTHILWALEVLAWEPAFLPRVVLLLGKLNQLDKGKAYANRPSASLQNILRWWYPQTSASLSERKNVIGLMIKRNPEAAFKLLLSLAPHFSDIAMNTHQPVWRLKDYQKITFSEQDYIEGLRFNCENLLALAGDDPVRWTKVIKLVDDYIGELRKMIIKKAMDTPFEREKSEEFRETLRSLLRTHAGAKKEGNWNLTQQEQADLTTVYDKLIHSAADRFGWYFNVDTIETRKTGDDWEKQQKLMAHKRMEGLSKILAEGGLAAILELAPKIKYPFSLGQTLARLHTKTEPTVILKITEQGNLATFALGYISGHIEKQGLPWIELQVDNYQQQLPEDKLIIFYLTSEGSPEVWSAVEKRSASLANTYWNTIFTQYHTWIAKENKEACIINLNKHKRFGASINQIYDETKIRPKIIAETLIGYATERTEQDINIGSEDWLIRKLYKYILNKNIPTEQLHQIEWYYFDLLKKDNREPSLIKYLYEDIANNPASFATLIRFAYLPEDSAPFEEIKDTIPANVQGRAKNAHNVLHSWTLLPGTDTTGNYDFIALRKYIKEAIIQCEQVDRKLNGIRELGALIGRAEIPGHAWPHPEFCEIIEEMNDLKFNQGVSSGFSNRRAGEVNIRPATKFDDNGRQAGLKLKERAAELASMYPVTAGIVDQIAESKLHWAAFMTKRDQQNDD